MASLKQKTVHGVIWSFIGDFSLQGIAFIIGIILARLLGPREFGLVGTITVFITLSDILIESGFNQALIRKKNCTPIDYSTVFYFNLLIGVVCFALLFISAPYISRFFHEPQLKQLVRVLGVVIVISSLTIVQTTNLVKRIDFKLQTKINVISALASGVVGITMAYSGYGVWSLVAKTIAQKAVNSLLLWLWNKWRPIPAFSKESFKEFFSFGSKILLSGLINTLYKNIYYLVIAKYFSAIELGLYTRANKFKQLPSENIQKIVSKVTYPVLAHIQDDEKRLKEGYRKIIKSTTLVTFVLMLGMAAVAEPMVITLIGEQWRASILYLQLLCFIGMMYPLHSINLNMLKVLGRSDICLKLEIIKKIVVIPTIVIGVIFGMKVLLLGAMVNTLIAYSLNSYWPGKFIKYPMKEQVLDILPVFLIALINSIIVFFVGLFIPWGYEVKLIVQLFVGAVLVFFMFEITKNETYLFLKDIVISKIAEKKKSNGNYKKPEKDSK